MPKLSEELKKMMVTVDAMSFILDSVSRSLADFNFITEPGSDTFSQVLDWQLNFNDQLKQLKFLVDDKFKSEMASVISCTSADDKLNNI